MAKYPIRMAMPTVKPVAAKPAAPKAKPAAKAAPKIDMSPKAVLGRAERIQREEALESKGIPLRSSVTRTTVNERTTPTKKGKR